MTPQASQLTESLIAAIPGAGAYSRADRPAISVPPDAIPELMQRLRDTPGLDFDMLLSHTAVDWMEKDAIELLYQLYSLKQGHYLTVSVTLPRQNPVAPSISRIWRIAEWQEREVYDMFGVRYSGHPDLRRILLEDSWQGHPLRKDYQDSHMLERPK